MRNNHNAITDQLYKEVNYIKSENEDLLQTVELQKDEFQKQIN